MNSTTHSNISNMSPKDSITVQEQPCILHYNCFIIEFQLIPNWFSVHDIICRAFYFRLKDYLTDKIITAGLTEMRS